MNTSKTQPAKLITLLQLFDDKKFEIPDYQRGYSWDRDQIKDLLSDIELHNSKYDTKHFTGTIVVEQKKGSDIYQIVDGQQRLVTCVMILKAIVELNPEKLKGLESILYKTDTGYSSTLKLSDQDRKYFEQQILNGIDIPGESASNTRLLEGYKLIGRELKKLEIDEVYRKLTTEIGFIFFETSSNKETTTLFEVINNRGKVLSELEKMKNYFLHLCNLYDFQEVETELNSQWKQILFYLDKAGISSVYDENQFVRNSFGVVFWRVKKDTEDLYKSFKVEVMKHINGNIEETASIEEQKSRIEALANDLSNYIDFLVTSSQAYAFLFNRRGYFRDHGNELYSKELDGIFKKLRNHGSYNTVIPLILSLMYLYINYPSSRDKIIETLKIVEIFNFRLYCLPNIFYRSDTKKTEVFEAASEVYRGEILDNEEEAEDDYDVIVQKNEFYVVLKEYLTLMIEAHCPASRFVEALTLGFNETYDFFSWKDSLNLFLAKYEHYLRRNVPNWDYESLLFSEGENEKMEIEHILAVDNKELFEEKDALEKRRLGNFILISKTLNSQLGKRSISNKIAFLKKNSDPKTLLLQLNEMIVLFENIENETLKKNNNTINRRREIVEKFFDARETSMIKFALSEWRYPGEELYGFKKIDTISARAAKRKSRYYPDHQAKG